MWAGCWSPESNGFLQLIPWDAGDDVKLARIQSKSPGLELSLTIIGTLFPSRGTR